MILSHAQRKMLQDLEEFRFNESNRFSKIRDAIIEKWKDNCVTPDDFQSYNREMKAAEGPPFWNVACCTRMKDQVTRENGDGSLTMTWFLEWDIDSANKVFIEGCEWANAHGAAIPIE